MAMVASDGPSALPKYIQISERLIREIAAGHLRNGARLPPEREMAEELGIAVGTLRKALADLEEKGLLERIHGSGNYVRFKADVASVYGMFRLERLQGGGLPTAEILSVQRMAKPADAPDFGPAKDAHRIRRLRSLDKTVIAIEEIWLDGSYGGVLSVEDLSDSLYLFYKERLDLVIGTVEDRIGVANVPDWADKRFGVACGDATGFIERVSWATHGTAAEYSRTWFDHNKARYVSRMGKG